MGQTNEKPNLNSNIKNTKNKENKIKIILLGDKNVGKTEFLRKISNKIINNDKYFESIITNYSYENIDYIIKIYAIKKDIYSKTTVELIKTLNFDGALLLFDNNDQKSIKNIEKYRKLFTNEFPTVLIQNKCENDENEDFSTYFTDKIPQNNSYILRSSFNSKENFYVINSFKTSALNGYNVKNSIDYLIDYIIHLKKIKITEVDNKWNLIEDFNENNNNENNNNENNNNNNENNEKNENFVDLEKAYLKIIIFTDDKNYSNNLIKNWEEKFMNEKFDNKLIFNYFDKNYCFCFEIFDNNEIFLENLNSNENEFFFGLFFIYKHNENDFFNYCKNFEKIIKIIPNFILKISEENVNYKKKEEFNNLIKEKNFNSGIYENFKNENEILNSLNILLKKIVLLNFGKNNNNIKEEIRNSLCNNFHIENL